MSDHGVGRSVARQERERSKSAATRRGVHERLTAFDPDRRGTYNPRRTLRFRVEFARQITRRRTHIVFGLMLILPVVFAGAFQLGGSAGSGAPELIGLATVGGFNFALFTEFVTVGFLLVVVVALLAGDTVASEASWSSLRYLLAQPVPRARLLRQKLAVAGVMCIAVNALLPLWAFLVGGAFFGFHPARSPLGTSFDAGESILRMSLVTGYVCIQLFGVGAIAFFLSVCVDNPLGAVGGAVLFTVVSNIVDQITPLGTSREFLLAHWDYTWEDALSAPVRWDDMFRGTGVALTYIAVFLGLAFLRFDRKDIVS